MDSLSLLYTTTVLTLGNTLFNTQNVYTYVFMYTHTCMYEYICMLKNEIEILQYHVIIDDIM